MKVIGISLDFAQGDMKGSVFVPDMLNDVNEITDFKNALETTGEMTVTGWSVCSREDNIPAVVEPTAGVKLEHKTLYLEHADGTQSLIVGKITNKTEQITAIATALKAEATIAGKKVTDVKIKSGKVSA